MGSVAIGVFLLFFLFPQESRAQTPEHCKSLALEVFGQGVFDSKRIRHLPPELLEELTGFLRGKPPGYSFTTREYATETGLVLKFATARINLARLAGILGRGQKKREFSIAQGPSSVGWEAFRGKGHNKFVQIMLALFNHFGTEETITLKKYLEDFDHPPLEGNRPPPPAWKKKHFLPYATQALVAGLFEELAPGNYRFIGPPPENMGRTQRVAAKLKDHGVPPRLWQRASEEISEDILDRLLSAFAFWRYSPFRAKDYIARFSLSHDKYGYRDISQAQKMGILQKAPGFGRHYLFLGPGAPANPLNTLKTLMGEKGIDPEVWSRAHLLEDQVRFRLIEVLAHCEGLICPLAKYKEITNVSHKIASEDMRKAYLAGVMGRGTEGEITLFRTTPGPVGWKLLEAYGARGQSVNGYLRKAYDRFKQTPFSWSPFMKEVNVSRSAADNALRAGKLTGILGKESRSRDYFFALPPKLPRATRESSPDIFNRLDSLGISREPWERISVLSPASLRKIIGALENGVISEPFKSPDSLMKVPFFLGLVERGPKPGHFLLKRGDVLQGRDLFDAWGDRDLKERIDVALDYFKREAFSYSDYEDLAKSLGGTDTSSHYSLQQDLWLAELAGLLEKKGGQYVPALARESSFSSNTN